MLRSQFIERAWIWKMDARPSRSASPQQGGVERVGPVRRHEYLDVPARLEAVKLVDDLQHRPLHLIVSACTVVEPRAANRIPLVEKDNARLLRSSHLEELAHHPRTLAHVLLHKLPNECVAL